MKFDIAKSLNGDKILFIARDTSGIVRFRAETLEKLHEAIKNYKPPLQPESEEAVDLKPKRKGFSLKNISREKKSVEETKTFEDVKIEQFPKEQAEEKKEFLKSETKEVIETKRKTSGKKTFWDRLK